MPSRIDSKLSRNLYPISKPLIMREERECHERGFSVRKSTDINKPIYDTVRCNRVSTRMRMSEREHVIISCTSGSFRHIQYFGSSKRTLTLLISLTHLLVSCAMIQRTGPI